MRSQLERKPLAIARRELARLAESGRLIRFPAAPPPGQPDLKDEELVERQPPPAAFGLVLTGRAMERDERVGPLWQARLGLHSGGQVVHVVAGVGERLSDQLAELLDGHLFARRVHGREVGRRRGAVQVVGADGELVAAELAPQADSCARLELLGQPDLVEPDRRDLSALVRYASLDDCEAPSRPAHGSPAHFSRDRDFLLSGK